MSSCLQVDQANLFIGTGGIGFGYGGVNPGAQYPHGPMRLGPDTTNALPNIGYRHFSGYNYLDTKVRMFSHTHFVGAGINGLGNLGVMPVRLGPGEEDMPIKKWMYAEHDSGDKNITFNNLVWWSQMDKDTEVAKPGHYQVHLDTPAVDASLLATGTLTAIHHYDFAPSSSGRYTPAVVIDVCHSSIVSPGVTRIRDSRCRNASLKVSQDGQSFTASMLGDKDIWMYFYGEFTGGGSALSAEHWSVCSNPSAQDEGDSSFSCSPGAKEGASDNGILFSRVAFKSVEESSRVELRVGLSFISTDMARENYLQDFPADTPLLQGDFQERAETTTQKWCDALDFLAVTPLEGDEDMAAMLYSASYRARLTPTIYTEAGGLYLGLDKAVHNVTQERGELYHSGLGSDKVGHFFSDLSFWDTFRAAHPWQLLTDESLAVGVLRSVSEMTVQQNAFPRWVLANQDISCMVGLHGAAMAVEAAKSGLGSEFDLKGLQSMLQQQATQPWPKNGRTDLDFYLENGYVSSESSDHSASLTLTTAYDDFVLAELSTLVGDEASAQSASQRAQNYRNSWSAEKRFMCPRSSSGELQCSKTATSPDSWQNYVEGDGLHWSYFVLQDPPGLISLFNSTQDFENDLELFFTEHVKYTEKFGESVPNPYYWVGNEVDHFSVYLFNYGTKCTLTQKWSRAVTHQHFSNTPHGVPGNEDYGAMSSLLLFSSLGIFPRAGSTDFLVGSPRVRAASLRLTHLDGSSSVLEISTINNSVENVYVSKLLVNGVDHRSTVIDRAVLMDPAGCKLEFTMSAEPVSSLCQQELELVK